MGDGTTHRRNLLAREVVAWRRERLAAAGFATGLARTLALERGMDLHALIQLTEGGCPPATAARILAPLDTAPDDSGDHRRC